MKKLLGTSTLLAGIVLFSNTALAAEVEVNPTVMESPLSITLDSGNPPNQSKGPFADHLSFTWAPTEFAFGSKPAKSGLTQSFELDSAHAKKQWVVVNDDRPKEDTDKGTTWDVKVKMDKLVTADDASTLGGSLVLKMSDVNEYHMGTKMKGDDIDPAEPNTAGTVTPWAAGNEPGDIYLGQSATALTGTDLEVVAGAGDINVMNQKAVRAKDDVRQGYASNITSASLKLQDVNTGNLGKTFTTKVVWTLTRDI